MSNKTFMQLLCAGVVAVGATSCGSHEYLVYSPGENLSALTKVTESDYRCDYPNGGDNGRNLFFAVHEKRGGISNIYRKENPISASMNQKTSGMNENMAPSYCPTTDQVAFSARLEGNSSRDIYMVKAGGGNALTQLTNTPDAAENFPSLSRDGKRMVYQKTMLGANPWSSEIWVKNLTTNESTLLTLGLMPAYSPDGQHIAFIKYTSDAENTCLWIMNADGSNQVQVTDAKMGIVRHPCFSPDGRYIAFQCYRAQKRDFDLYVIDRSGDNLTQLTVNKSYDGEPYWANDGNIYFTSDRGGRDGNYQIWRFKFGMGLSGVSTRTTTTTQNTQATGAATYHRVAKGETISQIAQKYGVTVRDIVKWNNLQTMTLKEGMNLKVSE